MTRYLAVTTCNASIWQSTGRRMAQSFALHWPIPLCVYTEGFRVSDQDVPASKVDGISLDEAAPWLEPWKAERTKAQRGVVHPPDLGKRGERRTYNYRLDAVKFSHKIAAIGAAAAAPVNVLIWIDADIVTYDKVAIEWLESLFLETADIAWLDRVNKYPECGFMMFRLPKMLAIIDDIVEAYQTCAIFRYPETHDSYVIQQIVEAAVKRGEIVAHSLSGAARVYSRHVFVNSRLGEKCDHLKGMARKAAGRSHRSDLQVPRTEAYWR